MIILENLTEFLDKKVGFSIFCLQLSENFQRKKPGYQFLKLFHETALKNDITGTIADIFHSIEEKKIKNPIFLSCNLVKVTKIIKNRQNEWWTMKLHQIIYHSRPIPA